MKLIPSRKTGIEPTPAPPPGIHITEVVMYDSEGRSAYRHPVNSYLLPGDSLEVRWKVDCVE